MATIRKRSARWEVQVRHHGYPVVNRALPTKADAVAWAAVVESEMARGAFIDRSLAERTTFRDLLVRYEREITVHNKGAVVEACRIRSLTADTLQGGQRSSSCPTESRSHRVNRPRACGICDQA